MSEECFALDGLYAAGWWPSQGDRCTLRDDGRWGPDETLILDAFSASGITLVIRRSLTHRVHQVCWRTPRGGQETVMAKSRQAALTLAFVRLYTATSQRVPEPV